MAETDIAAPRKGRKHRSPVGEALFRFRRLKLAMTAFVALCLLFVVGLTFFVLGKSGVHWPSDPDATRLEEKLLPPSGSHPLGTDQLGRDVLTRILQDRKSVV